MARSPKGRSQYSSSREGSSRTRCSRFIMPPLGSPGALAAASHKLGSHLAATCRMPRLLVRLSRPEDLLALAPLLPVRRCSSHALPPKLQRRLAQLALFLGRDTWANQEDRRNRHLELHRLCCNSLEAAALILVTYSAGVCPGRRLASSIRLTMWLCVASIRCCKVNDHGHRGHRKSK